MIRLTKTNKIYSTKLSKATLREDQRPQKIFNASDTQWRRQPMRLRQRMALEKWRTKATQKTEEIHSLPRAHEDSAMYAHLKPSERPDWLQKVSAQNFANRGVAKRHEQHSHGLNLNTKLFSPTVERQGKLKGALRVSRTSTLHMKPWAAAWYSDQETLEYGELWDKYNEDMIAVRAYLKEQILNKQNHQESGFFRDTKNFSENDIPTRPPMPKNVSGIKQPKMKKLSYNQFVLRLAYNKQWNDENKQIRDQAYEELLYIQQRREEAIKDRMELMEKMQKQKSESEIEDFVKHQYKADIKQGLTTESKIDYALKNPVNYNFAVNPDQSISDRRLPIQSENIDQEAQNLEDKFALEHDFEEIEESIFTPPETPNYLYGTQKDRYDYNDNENDDVYEDDKRF